MSTVPFPAGDVAVIEVALLTVNEAALVLPNLTAVAPVKLAPVIITLDPPAELLGEIEITDGVVAEVGELVSSASRAAAPPLVITVTSAIPVLSLIHISEP